jgi:shikimate dehydrogenase
MDIRRDPRDSTHADLATGTDSASLDRQLGRILAAKTSKHASSRQAEPEKPAFRVGLIGRGIQESRSPHMHEAEGARLGFSYIYALLDFDSMALADNALPEVIRSAERCGLAGLNVTHPFKEQVIQSLTDLSADAAMIGAVNTVVFDSGRRVGHNTDCWGYAESFRRNMAGASLGKVTLLGAGGAGMAVARALLDLGVGELMLSDIDKAKAEALRGKLTAGNPQTRVFVAGDLQAAIRSSDGLVNATPMGMAKYPGMPIPESWLRPDLWVSDIVYFPRETELLAKARARGSRGLGGTDMAIFQAVKAFELITGVAPDAEAMAEHFERD